MHKALLEWFQRINKLYPSPGGIWLKGTSHDLVNK